MFTIEEIKEKAVPIAKKYKVKSLSLFGSYAKGTQNEKSDVDFIIEFDEPYVSLILISGLKNDLEENLKVKVDVIHGPISQDCLLDIDKKVDLYES